MGSDLGQVAVAFVGHDDRGAGLGNQEVGAGDPDVGVQIALAQDLPGLADQVGGFTKRAIRGQVLMMGPEIRLDLFLGDVDRGRDDVAGRLFSEAG